MIKIPTLSTVPIIKYKRQSILHHTLNAITENIKPFNNAG